MAAGGVGIMACWGAYSMLSGNAMAPARVRARTRACACQNSPQPKLPLWLKLCAAQPAAAEALTQEQKKTKRIRSHLSGGPATRCPNARVRAPSANVWVVHAEAPGLRGVTDSWPVRAGNHPSVSGGDDCNSRKAANLKSHASSGDTHVGEAEKRRLNQGTVTHH